MKFKTDDFDDRTLTHKDAQGDKLAVTVTTDKTARAYFQVSGPTGVVAMSRKKALKLAEKIIAEVQ